MIKSNKINVYDQLENNYNDNTLSPKFPSVISQNNAQSLLSDAFNQGTATSDQGADLYKGQEGNSDFKQVKRMFDSFDKYDNNILYTTNVTIKSITPVGNGKSNVLCDFKYLFNRSDNSRLVQVMEYRIHN